MEPGMCTNPVCTSTTCLTPLYIVLHSIIMQPLLPRPFSLPLMYPPHPPHHPPTPTHPHPSHADLPVIKVTAFDDPTITPSAAAHDDSGHVDLLVYPDAVRYEQLPVHLLQLVFDAHMGLLETPREASPLTQYMVPMAYMQLFVCCHGARDARCGARGPPVVRRLMEVVREWGLEEQVEVFPCSHVGGHQVLYLGVGGGGGGMGVWASGIVVFGMKQVHTLYVYMFLYMYMFLYTCSTIYRCTLTAVHTLPLIHAPPPPHSMQGMCLCIVQQAPVMGIGMGV